MMLLLETFFVFSPVGLFIIRHKPLTSQVPTDNREENGKKRDEKEVHITFILYNIHIIFPVAISFFPYTQWMGQAPLGAGTTTPYN